MLDSDSFSYGCTRCGKCCQHKGIQLTPYEIARLARRFGVTTAQFREDHTDGGIYLKRDGADQCVFFETGSGCSVHLDRPLVCRLFPLGRSMKQDGSIHYWVPKWVPPPNGRFGNESTIDRYLDEQGAHPFIATADGYFRWYLDVMDEATVTSVETDGCEDLLDIDDMLAADSAKSGVPEPKNVEDRAWRHLAILNALILTKGDSIAII